MAHLRNRVTQTISQARRRWQLPYATIALLTLVVGTLLGTLYLYQASQAAEMGRQVEQLKQTKAALERQNAVLEAEIAAAQDPDHLMRRARELGFQEAGPAEIDYLALPKNGASGAMGGGEAAPQATSTAPNISADSSQGEAAH